MRKYARLIWMAVVLVAGGAAAQAPRAPEIPQIVAQGTAEVRVAPDRAIAGFGVEFQAPDARTAQARVNEAMQQVIQALRGLNLPENRIRTERLELTPVYEQPRPREGETRPRLVGYRAANQVRVELDNVSRLGPVIDAAVGAGANGIEGIQFTLANEAPHRIEALRQAADEARNKARAIAAALDVDLGSLIGASEGGVQVIGPPPVAFAREAFASTPVQPGEINVHATVTVHYQILPRK